MANGLTSSVVIEELTGDKRRVELRASAAPYRPTEWSVEQNVKTSWYNGNTEGSQQVLGPRDPPSEWEGAWHRTLLGKIPALLTDPTAGATAENVTFPATLRDLFDDICRKGQRLRVTWTATDGAGIQHAPTVREGVLQKFTYPTHRLDDIDWKMKFEWAGRGGAQQRVVATRAENIAPFLNDLQAKADAHTAAALRASLIAANSAKPGSATQFTLGQLERLTQLPNQLLTSFTRSLSRVVGQLQQVGDIVNKARNIPLQLANTALAFARNTVAVANQYQDQLGRRSPEQNSNSMQLADLTRSATYFWGTHDTALLAARSAQSLIRGMSTSAMRRSAQSTRTILAVHVVRQNDTLMSVSRKYYGSVDHADQIARANRLPWSTTSVYGVRRVLIVPVLDTVQVS